MSTIYLINGGVRTPLKTLITANLHEALDSSFSLDFTAHQKDVELIGDGTVVEHEGQYFNVTWYHKYANGYAPMCDTTCEHVTYILNHEDYKLENFVYSGSKSGAVAAVLAGTPFSVGSVEPSGNIDISIQGGTRRAVLLSVVALIGGEIQYNGYSVNVKNHRGSVPNVELLGTKNVTNIGLNRDVLGDVTSYDITLGRRTTLSLGDNLHIVYSPLKINSYTRITSIDYDPYDPFVVTVGVGDMEITILDTYAEIKEAAEKVEGFDDRIKEAEDNISDAKEELKTKTTKNEVDASISTYVNSEAGTASIVLACTGKFAKVNDITGFKTETEVRAIINSEINQNGGSIKMFVEGKNYLTETTAAGTFVKSTELYAGITSYVNTSTGIAQITSAMSGTYQTKDAMSGYTTTTQVTNSIDQQISPLETKISLVVGVNKLVDSGGNANASLIISAINGASSATISANKVNLSGYVTITNLGTAGAVTINGGNIAANTIDVGTIKNTYISGSTSGVTFPSGIASPYLYQCTFISPPSGSTLTVGQVGVTVALRGTVTVNGNEILTSAAMSGYATTAQLSGYSLSGHTHSGMITTSNISSYAITSLSGYATQTWVSTNYATVGHSHSGYATTSQLSSYALSNHTHSSLYAAINHSHSGYATTSQLSSYALSSHTHSSLYAAISHSHNYATNTHYHTVTVGSSSYNTTSPK